MTNTCGAPWNNNKSIAQIQLIKSHCEFIALKNIFFIYKMKVLPLIKLYVYKLKCIVNKHSPTLEIHIFFLSQLVFALELCGTVHILLFSSKPLTGALNNWRGNSRGTVCVCGYVCTKDQMKPCSVVSSEGRGAEGYANVSWNIGIPL